MCVCSQRPSVSFTAKDSKILQTLPLQVNSTVYLCRREKWSICNTVWCHCSMCAYSLLLLSSTSTSGYTLESLACSLFLDFGFYFHKTSSKLKGKKNKLTPHVRMFFSGILAYSLSWSPDQWCAVRVSRVAAAYPRLSAKIKSSVNARFVFFSIPGSLQYLPLGLNGTAFWCVSEAN